MRDALIDDYIMVSTCKMIDGTEDRPSDKPSEKEQIHLLSVPLHDFFASGDEEPPEITDSWVVDWLVDYECEVGYQLSAEALYKAYWKAVDMHVDSKVQNCSDTPDSEYKWYADEDGISPAGYRAACIAEYEKYRVPAKRRREILEKLG